MKNYIFKTIIFLFMLTGFAYSQTTPDQIFKSGLEAYYGARYMDGIKFFDDYIKMKPSDYNGYNYRGLCNQGLKNYQQALQDFGQVIQIAKSNSDGYINRGYTYLLMKNYASATTDFSDAIRYDPKSIEAYIGKSRVNIAQRKFNEATKELNSAAAVEPKNARIYINKAYVDFLKDDTVKIFEDVSSAMFYDSNVVFTNHKRELLLIKFEFYKNAIEIADQRVKQNPYSYMNYFSRGLIYFFMNNFPKATADFKKADELNNNRNPKFDALDEQILRSIDRNSNAK